jgi:hypothetical protein
MDLAEKMGKPERPPLFGLILRQSLAYLFYSSFLLDRSFILFYTHTI